MSSKQHVGPSNLSHSPVNCILPQYVALFTGGGHGLRHTGKNMMAINKTSYYARSERYLWLLVALTLLWDTKNCVVYWVRNLFYCVCFSVQNCYSKSRKINVKQRYLFRQNYEWNIFLFTIEYMRNSISLNISNWSEYEKWLITIAGWKSD